MTFDPRLARADKLGFTRFGVRLQGLQEGWRGPGCYAVIASFSTPTDVLVLAGWLDPMTKKGTPRKTLTVGSFKFYQHEVGDTVHVFRIDEWSPPAA